MLLSRPLCSERLTERAVGPARTQIPDRCRWNGTDRTTIATDGKMLNSYAVLLALCLGQSEVTTSPRSGFSSSDNFVVYAPDQELADEVLKKAEQLRTQLAKAWLGKELATGEGVCMIRIKLSQTEHSALTWPKEHPAKHYHNITIKSQRANVVGNTLAHELTHVVMATEFPGKLPRWADEGVATFQDHSERNAKRWEWLASFVQTGNWPNLETILLQNDVTSNDHIFYIVAHSLTEFLLEQDETEVFFRFAVHGKEKSWELAAQRHYEFRSLQDMESRWHGWVAEQLRRRNPMVNSAGKIQAPRSTRGLSASAVERVAR